VTLCGTVPLGVTQRCSRFAPSRAATVQYSTGQDRTAPYLTRAATEKARRVRERVWVFLLPRAAPESELSHGPDSESMPICLDNDFDDRVQERIKRQAEERAARGEQEPRFVWTPPEPKPPKPLRKRKAR